MKSLVFVSSLLVAAGAATAAPFQALSYEAGGGLAGIAGQGFTVSAGGFFSTGAQGGTNTAGGSAAGFTAAGEGEFDSHFSLDGFGPSARNRSTSVGDNSVMTLSFYGDYGAAGVVGQNYNELESTAQNGFGPFVGAGASFVTGPGSHVGDPAGDGSNPENSARAGIAVAPPPVSSHFAPNATGGRSTNDGVFVGRFTIQADASLEGGIFFNTSVGPGESFGANLVLGGPAVMFNTANGMQALVLRAYRVGTTFIDNPSDVTAEGLNEGTEFGEAAVWDLWVHTDIPAPGAMGLMGLAGIAAIRRRRA